MKKKQKVEKEEEVFADDDAPPVLVPEEGSAFEEVVISDEQVSVLRLSKWLYTNLPVPGSLRRRWDLRTWR
jgi:hypothetical protein